MHNHLLRRTTSNYAFWRAWNLGNYHTWAALRGFKTHHKRDYVNDVPIHWYDPLWHQAQIVSDKAKARYWFSVAAMLRREAG